MGVAQKKLQLECLKMFSASELELLEHVTGRDGLSELERARSPRRLSFNSRCPNFHTF